ncbi:hypothetical protein BCT30_07080 [Enterovibrio norvegicus]|nr:hypothetical protein BCU47_15250 [Enterovibrio norvegicus]PMI35311.1 hypothetical protein BCU46_18670 [Enterovibrio norvegicus]PMN56214.1 hypothetical protein BCT30_07080 [Enterovibrio norvegicus]
MPPALYSILNRVVNLGDNAVTASISSVASAFEFYGNHFVLHRIERLRKRNWDKKNGAQGEHRFLVVAVCFVTGAFAR